MRFKLLTLIGALALITGGSPVSASAERRGELHLTKECSQYTGLPGSFCTFTKSNLAAIKRGSRVFYDQADGIPTGMLDSNVVLDAGRRKQSGRSLHARRPERTSGSARSRTAPGNSRVFTPA